MIPPMSATEIACTPTFGIDTAGSEIPSSR